MMNGRKKDVLIEDELYTDPRTGVEKVNDLCFTVWADAGNKDLIESVEGVTHAFVSPAAKTKYSVYYDQRYDREWIKREVEAALLIGKPPQP